MAKKVSNINNQKKQLIILLSIDSKSLTYYDISCLRFALRFFSTHHRCKKPQLVIYQYRIEYNTPCIKKGSQLYNFFYYEMCLPYIII